MKRRRCISPLQSGIFVAILLFVNAKAQDPAAIQSSQQTVARWKQMAWWPTSGAPAREAYAGSESCAKCHSGIAATQGTTPMFLAARRPGESELLLKHPSLPFSEEGFEYLLTNTPKESHFAVKSSASALSASVDWAFGSGEVAQTYMLKRDNNYLESRLTYYTSLHSLGITTGHSSAVPQTMEDTLGDVVDPEITARCFGCHTTASTTSGKFEPEHAVGGLGCEACHGPGVRHIAAIKAGGKDSAIFAANKLSPVDSVDFCGACHRTPVDVAVELPPNLGIANLRFQPYRLERSHCWGEKGDARITCVACHDPHKPLVREAAAYDAKCLACHAATGAEPAVSQVAGCKVAAKECTSCHMPTYEIPAVHAEFTDHYIRVVRPDTGFRP